MVANNYSIPLDDSKEIKIETVDIDNEVYEEYIQEDANEPISEVKIEETYENFNPESPEYMPPAKTKKKTASPKVSRGNSNHTDPADDKKILLFASMFCEICNEPLESMANAASHYRREHNVKGYIKCCGRKFFQRYRLLDHVNTHLNISYICQVCGKKFDTKQYLRNHMVHHEDVKNFVRFSLKFVFALKINFKFIFRSATNVEKFSLKR